MSEEEACGADNASQETPYVFLLFYYINDQNMREENRDHQHAVAESSRDILSIGCSNFKVFIIYGYFLFAGECDITLGNTIIINFKFSLKEKNPQR